MAPAPAWDAVIITQGSSSPPEPRAPASLDSATSRETYFSSSVQHAGQVLPTMGHALPLVLGDRESLLASWKIPEAELGLRGRTWQQGAGRWGSSQSADRWGSSQSAPLWGKRQRLSPGGAQGTPSTNATSSCGSVAGTAAEPSLYHLQQSIYSQ